jgi:predicted Zn-dependent peptidase
MLVAQSLKQARGVMQSLVGVLATPDELAQAKSELAAQRTKDLARAEGLARVWLDGDTFRFQTTPLQPASLDQLTPADLQRVATRLFKDVPVASVAIGDAKQLQATLEPTIKIELMGEVEPRPAKSETKPAMTIPTKKPE